ncbi:GNAT family N-acetyltransferase [Acidicapsa dinghuensis]|uniref:GNAT family N-acetyltransferase n=1 Tax=Acidicapsa dinghuensis TaxID=2218256 RepID=A0ABW1EE08_9BACT|nr:GNAT family N-acetyltransferase [Acidicapsa dinghuensis]
MASGLSVEILDLRHFASPMLRPVLEAESVVWRQRLNWDYLASAKLLLQYLDSRSLPGYVALDNGRVTGYVFCVYEDTKAVIGDVFALPNQSGDSSQDLLEAEEAAREVEESLLSRLLELLLHSPGVDRIESQLLLHRAGEHSEILRRSGFEVYRRLYMRQSLASGGLGPVDALPPELEIRPWTDQDLNPAGRLIAEAYRDHPDSRINDQYRTVHGSQRFLQNIVRFPGCGVFSPQASHVVYDRRRRELVALILGSRVSLYCGHITQVCVHPSWRQHGLGCHLLRVAAREFRRLGMMELTLTVTEANERAVNLYLTENYEASHAFSAAFWNRNGASFSG